MQQYRNKPENFGNFRKQILAKTIPLMAAALLTGLAISYYSEGSAEESMQSAFVYIIVVAIFFTYSIFRGVKRQKAIFYSYELTIGDNYLLRKQQGLADKKLSLDAIDSITEDNKGILYIRGTTKEDLICVFPYLEHYTEVKAKLLTIQPLSGLPQKSFSQKYAFAGIFVMLGLMGTTYISENKAVSVTAGCLLIAGLIWSFYKIRASTYFDNRIKRRAWFTLFLIFCVLITLYFKLV